MVATTRSRTGARPARSFAPSTPVVPARTRKKPASSREKTKCGRGREGIKGKGQGRPGKTCPYR